MSKQLFSLKLEAAQTVKILMNFFGSSELTTHIY
jgi:hypothetical protein